jgi:hypothetical protein
MSTFQTNAAPQLDRSVILSLATATAPQPSPTQAYVNQYLPQRVLAGVQLLTGAPQSLALRGSYGIEGDMDFGAAGASGLGNPSVRGWYLAPVPIVISGDSYLGAYPGISVPDGDFMNMLAMLEASSAPFHPIAGPRGNGNAWTLTLNGYPRGANRWRGTVQRFRFSEKIAAVHMVSYTLSFLGLPADLDSLRLGTQAATQDVSAYGGSPLVTP